jgi:hypothetical protein
MASSGDGGDGGSSGYESEEAVAPPPKKIRKAREFPSANPTLLQGGFSSLDEALAYTNSLEKEHFGTCGGILKWLNKDKAYSLHCSPLKTCCLMLSVNRFGGSLPFLPQTPPTV